MKTPVANFLRKHFRIFLVGVLGLAVGAGYLSKTILHLCDPATVYIGIACWSLLFLSLYSAGRMIKKLSLSTFAVEGIQVVIWAWIITLSCSYGYTILSWVLVILSAFYYATGILLNLEI
jgi:hypothetical protein